MLVSQFIAQAYRTAEFSLVRRRDRHRGQADQEQGRGDTDFEEAETENPCLRACSVSPSQPRYIEAAAGLRSPPRPADRSKAAGSRCASVDVAARRVTLQPRCQPARAQRTADVTVQTGFEAYPTRPADLQVSMLRQRQQEHVGAGAGRNHWSPARLTTILSMRRWRVSAALAVSTWRTCSLRLL